jgi:hypothetical protein
VKPEELERMFSQAYVAGQMDAQKAGTTDPAFHELARRAYELAQDTLATFTRTQSYRVRTSEHDILDAMERYGGGFIVALSRCFRAADETNRRILLDGFLHYIKQYDEIAAEKEKHEA